MLSVISVVLTWAGTHDTRGLRDTPVVTEKNTVVGREVVEFDPVTTTWKMPTLGPEHVRVDVPVGGNDTLAELRLHESLGALTLRLMAPV